MTIQVTIIGLGRIGASIGLALSKHTDSLLRVGHDKEFSVEREALKRGALDQAEHNLPNAVKDAKVIVLALPVTEIRETFKYIAQDLQDGAVVLDVTPVKSEVTKWAKELLPEHAYYVGLVPAVSAEFLDDKKNGLDSAKPDLFKDGIFLVAAPSGSPGEAVELASTFVRFLGATPLLTDLLESDGLMATTHILPQLVATALLNATIDQPGWKDSRKMAGSAYHAAVSAVEFEYAEALRDLALHNKTNVIHALDLTISALQGLREDLETENADALQQRISAAREGRVNWLNERSAARWAEMQKTPADYPSLSERLFGSLTGRKVKKQK